MYVMCTSPRTTIRDSPEALLLLNSLTLEMPETHWKGLMVLNLMAAISLLYMQRKTARSRIKCDVIILPVVVVMAVDAAETEVEEMTLVTEATAVEGIATVVVMVVILVITSEVEDGTEAAAVAATEATVATVAA